MRHPARTIPYPDLLAGLLTEVDQGNVAIVRDGPLALFKYTDQCAFDRRWSQFSLIARGLILDTEAEKVVATPFPKFFNYGEGMAPHEPMEPLPDEPFEVAEKVDGSLAVIFHHAGRWRVVTRGSFTSDQAQWAQAHLDTNCKADALVPGTTYLCEIVYPENRIVISYEYAGLVLLAAYAESGEELARTGLERVALSAGFRLAKAEQYGSIGDLLAVAKTLSAQEEGFVVRFQSGRRIKIKGDEYCRVHRLISRVTPLAVWEMLIAGDDLGAIKRQLPEEFHVDLDAIVLILQRKFYDFVAAVSEAHARTFNMDDKALGLSLKDQALFAPEVARWIFPCRKKGFLQHVHEAGHDLRKKAFETFRPTANRLEGYAPSSAVNRFATEAA